MRVSALIVAALLSTTAVAQTPAYRQFNQRVKAGVPARVYTLFLLQQRQQPRHGAGSARVDQHRLRSPEPVRV
jgi:hypothetical protein